VVTPRERVISCLQWPAQHFGDGDGRGREAQVPAPRPSKSGSKREKERILLPATAQDHEPCAAMSKDCLLERERFEPPVWQIN
jgi:hypothetical protein